MGSRMKEDEKNEKAIRALTRKPPNRRCINCNSLGPQYVCLNFATFVCTHCSGIHREFTHRVKSVSMSKFSSQEVANLEAGGNENGRAIYFKDWDSQRQPFPDSSNVDRLREFIKMVYVERRFTGERPLPRNRGGDREETYDNRRSEPRPNYRADSRSPPYEDRYDDRGRRSNAGYDDRRSDERARFDEKRSPARFESERGRYERSYNDTRRYDERPRHETRNRQHNEDRYNEDRFANEKGSRGYGYSSPPPVRPVKEILGEDVPPLRVENHGSQANGSQDMDKMRSSQDGRVQRFGSSSSFGSVDGNIPAVISAAKREDSVSLIDFSVESEPVAAKEQLDPFGLTAAIQPAADTLNNTGWATFEPAAVAPSIGTVPQAPVVSSAQSLFGGFPSSSLGPGAQAPAVSSAQGLMGGYTNPGTIGDGNLQWSPQWPTSSGAQSADASANNWSSLAGPSTSAVSSQSWNAFPATISGESSVQASQGLNPVDTMNAKSAPGSGSQAAQAQISGRIEIPEDLFTPSIQYMGRPHFGSQYSAMGGMGFMPQGSYIQPQKSSNPFDLPSEGGPNQISREFPSLSSLHQALPTMSMGPRPVPPGPGFVAPGPGFGAHASHWGQSTMNPSQGLYPSASMSTGGSPFFTQQPQTVLPHSMQGSFGGNTSSGASLGPNLPGISLGASLPGSLSNPIPNSNPKQAPESFFPASNFQPSQNLFGGFDAMFPAQGFPGQLPNQNAAGLAAVGNISSADSFPAGPHRLLSQGSLGSLNNTPVGDPLFPSQPSLPGQRLVSHNSLGSLTSMTPSDSQFSVQVPQFPSHPVGNPFS